FGTFEALFAKSAALADHRENAQNLEARLIAARKEANEKLAPLGAALEDVDIISEPHRAATLIEQSCAALAAAPAPKNESKSVCPVRETPVGETMAFEEATLQLNADPAEIASRLAAVRPPVRIASLAIRGGAGPSPEITIDLQIAARRSEPAK
ncbi:MAG TPA: hypothetical protein VNH64_05070, partial [Parvularculaceae bacterium]|nr:hypothetical protein [Parvularculaceae bacterium]